MSTTAPFNPTASSPRSVPFPPHDRRLGALDIVSLSAWCGLAGGLLEVGTQGLVPGDRPDQATLFHESPLRLVDTTVELAGVSGRRIVPGGYSPRSGPGWAAG